MQRSDFVRPISVALSLTLLGEAIIFVVWGIYLFPVGNLSTKLVWTGTCGIAMGATIGGLVNVKVTGRLDGNKAAFWSGSIYFAVLGFCTVLCFQIDLATGSQFGAQQAPLLFVGGGIIPALITSLVYSWLLHSRGGNALLVKFGY